MNKKISYEDCLYFIENYLHIELLCFQKILLKHICNGEVIYGGRGCGRNTVVKGYAKYLSHLLDENFYEAKSNGSNYYLVSNKPFNKRIEGERVAMSPYKVKDGYFAELYHIDEEPIIEFKNGSWIKVKE
jgi:hypothetical protein